MYKKSILSVAIASALLLTGCFEDNKLDDENVGSVTNPPSAEQQEEFAETAGKTWPIFSPATSELPVPNDLIFDSVAKDGTFRVGDTSPPVTTALNALSGASTTAPIDIKISDLIDGDSLNASAIAGTNPNPLQNVFLLELDYASGSPLQGLSNQEPPTIVPPTSVAYNATAVELDGTSYIRINPLKPLKPNTRYIVVVTNEVKDAQGEGLIAHPGAAAYGALTDADRGLASPALAPVRALINGLWENVAVKYFDLATNLVRTALELPPLTADNIVISYSFTTSGDEKVLEYMANPTEWFNDLITTFVRVTAAKSVVTNQLDLNEDTEVNHTDVKLAADAAVAAFPNNASDPEDTSIKDALAPIEAAFPLLGCNGVTAGPTYINCIGAFFANVPSAQGGLADFLPKPKARTVTTVSANQPVSLVSAALSSLVANAAQPPLVSQGTIDVPYYLGIPTGSSDNEGAVINSVSWKADSTLASLINNVLQGLSPDAALAQGSARLADENGELTDETRDPLSTYVNYLFPFPKQTDADTGDATVDDLTIPWLAVRPHPAQAMQDQGTVIFQHGITTDRSAVLSVGTILAQAGFTVIGIDQVSHGVGPKSTESRLALAETLLTAGAANGLPVNPTDDATKQALVAGTFAIGFVMTAASVDATTANALITSVLGGGTTGNPGLDSAIRTLSAFQNTVANAGSVIPGIAATEHERHFNFTANALSQPTAMNFEPDNAFGASGSLYINLTNFTNSRDKNRQGVVDLLNLRQSLAAIDLDGDETPDLDTDNVYFAGHSLGTVIGIPFVTVANSTPVGNIKAASFLEPASGITRMLENSSNFGPRIIGGLAANNVTQGSFSYEAYLNVLQATLDSVDPINFADNLGGSTTGSFQTNADATGTLTILNAGTADVDGSTIHPSDLANVIEAETTQLTTQFGTSLPSFLAGVEKFATQLGATDVIGASVDASQDHIRTRLAFGKHGMFVLPSTPSATEPSQTSQALQAAAFNEGMTQTTRFFLDVLNVADTSGASSVANILIDEADFDARPNKQLNP
jgi:hypothetical protein